MNVDMDVVVNWVGALLLTAIVIGVPASCSVHTTNLKAQAIRDGADPIAADCAFSMSSESTKCALVAARLRATGKEEK